MHNLFEIIQYEMESQYQEKSSLTNLFVENKIFGWLGLYTIFFSICAILFYQIRSWDDDDRDENRFN